MILLILVIQLLFRLALPLDVTEERKVHVVSISNNHYQPNLTVAKVSDIIRFENNDQINHWPASNIHPTHDIYPEFDPKKPIKPGEGWGFEFKKEGLWRFHDHLDATLSGIILIKGDEDSADNEKSINLYARISSIKDYLYVSLADFYLSFSSTGKDYLQSQDIKNLIELQKNTKLGVLVKKYGAEKVINKLFEDSEKGRKFNCHTYSHAIGRISFSLFGKIALQEYIPLCHSGYQHGVIAAFVKSEGEEGLMQKLNDVCGSLTTNYAKLTCYHGAGHGMMAFTSNDLPGALKYCGEFDTKFKSSNCYVGAFMENIGSQIGDSLSTHPTIWLNNDDPHFPCNKLPQEREIQENCYATQPTWMDFIFKGDMNKVLNECLKANDYIPNCFFGYGQEAAAVSVGNAKRVANLCNQVPKKGDYYNRCIQGAQGVLMDFWADKAENPVKEFCSLMVNKTIQKDCYGRLNKRLIDLGLK